MLVPAIAFGWWLASVPMPSSAATANADETLTEIAPEGQQDEASDTASANETEEPGTAEGPHEHVKLRAPITPAMVRLAGTFLDLPMGAEREVEVGGVWCVFVLEWHYHPPGFLGGPRGWHKGVTVYERR